MLEVFGERLIRRNWIEVPPEAVANGKWPYVSRDFIVRNADNEIWAVADLSHLSDHYSPINTKNETFDGVLGQFAARGPAHQHGPDIGLQCIPPAQEYAQYYTMLVMLADYNVRYIQHIALPFDRARSG